MAKTKKMNVKTINLSTINTYIIASAKLEAESKRWSDERKLLKEDLAIAQKLVLENPNHSTLAEQKALASAEENHKLIARGLRAELNKVTRTFCPKEDEMYDHYASADGSDLFAQDIIDLCVNMGAHANDRAKSVKMVQHMIGWRTSNGRKVPEGRPTFVKSICSGIRTMLENTDLVVVAEDGTLSWK